MKPQKEPHTGQVEAVQQLADTFSHYRADVIALQEMNSYTLDSSEAKYKSH